MAISLRALGAEAGRAARDLARLVVPVECPGCGAVDVALCEECRALLAGPVRRAEAGAPRLDRPGRAPLPVWTLAAYAGPVREVVVAWKDRGRVDLTPVLAEALASGARDVAAILHAAVLTAAVADTAVRNAGGGTARPDPSPSVPPLLVVPAPSSPTARRRRGVDLVGVLAHAVADALGDAGVPATAGSVLVQRRGGRDQVGLSARARRANVRGRVRWRRRAARPEGRLVLLVDDVLTTGATLAACEDAARAVGGCVVAALTLAATPAPGRASRVEG